MPEAKVDDVALYYEWRGAERGPIVVFVNGLLTDATSWSGHLPYFADAYRCLVWDCRGQGRSSKPAHVYEVARHARDLAGLLDVLGIGEPVALVGLSNGGAAALDLASAAPERVAALVVSGAYASVDKLLEIKLGSWVAAMHSGGAGLRFDVATPWVWGGPFLANNWEGLLAYREKGLTFDVAASQRLIEGAMVHDVRSRLANIRAPTLVSVGEHDLLTPPWLSRAIVNEVPLARLEIMPGLGHAAALEDVAGFSSLARRFLDAAI